MTHFCMTFSEWLILQFRFDWRQNDFTLRSRGWHFRSWSFILPSLSKQPFSVWPLFGLHCSWFISPVLRVWRSLLQRSVWMLWLPDDFICVSISVKQTNKQTNVVVSSDFISLCWFYTSALRLILFQITIHSEAYMSMCACMCLCVRPVSWSKNYVRSRIKIGSVVCLCTPV